ncbi:unnamed protein product [Musa hybrid cultivar]
MGLTQTLSYSSSRYMILERSLKSILNIFLLALMKERKVKNVWIRKHIGMLYLKMLSRYRDGDNVSICHYFFSKLIDDLKLTCFDKAKVLGELNIFLGLEMMNTNEGIFISQISYIKKIIVRFGISKSKKVSTSLDANIKLIIRPYITFSVGLITFYAILI